MSVPLLQERPQALPQAAVPPDHGVTADAVQALLDLSAPGLDAAAQLQALVDAGLDRLPLPGSGRTLQRWQVLAAVGAHDLSLAKLFEGHTDALAILAELQDGAPAAEPVAAGATWGVWAAEPPTARAIAVPQADGSVRLQGRKAWCSGAATASHALLTAWQPDGSGPVLVRLALRQPAVAVRAAGWQAVGMAGSASLDVDVDGALGHPVGTPGDYLRRPGFWQGGAGVAACWHGGACGIAGALQRAVHAAADGPQAPFLRAALGDVDVVLSSTAALLREAAAWIDRHPRDDASAVALRVRLAADRAAQHVLAVVGRALGAGPFCRDARFARAAADLPVFIRQSHAERDAAALGARLPEAAPWSL